MLGIGTFEIMWREAARRTFVLVLAVALAAALVMRNVQAGNMDNMDVAAAATATDMPVHGKCDGCAGNEKAMTPAACSAYCGAIVAFPFLIVAYHPVPAETVEPRTLPAGTGHAAPPDPYPPRPTGMS